MTSLSHVPQSDKPRRVSLYCRVSTEDQSERGTIDSQIEFLRTYSRLYGLEVTGEYLDDGISGSVMLGDRPDGRRLLEDAREERFAEVIVYRLDRLGRTLSAL